MSRDFNSTGQHATTFTNTLTMDLPSGSSNFNGKATPAEYRLSSPNEEETDAGALSPVEPQPGLDGIPVRCKS
jgi:hypothetical protein